MRRNYFENKQVEQNRVDCNDIGLKDMYIYHKLMFLTIKQRKTDAFFDATDLLEQYNHVIEQVNNSNLPRFNKKQNSHNEIEDFFEWRGYEERTREALYVFGVYDDSYFVKTTKENEVVHVWLHATLIDIYLRWMRLLMDDFVILIFCKDIDLAMNALCEQRKLCNKGREIY